MRSRASRPPLGYRVRGFVDMHTKLGQLSNCRSAACTVPAWKTSNGGGCTSSEMARRDRGSSSSLGLLLPFWKVNRAKIPNLCERTFVSLVFSSSNFQFILSLMCCFFLAGRGGDLTLESEKLLKSSEI